MNIAQRLFLKMGERVLRFARSNASLFEDQHKEAYDHKKTAFVNLYTKAQYYHGTGRYHYEHHHDESRYTSDRGRQIVDVLGDILKEGIRPHLDRWVQVDNGQTKTISIARSRMYASLYAKLHLYETDMLTYEFGSIKQWFYIMFGVFLLEAFTHPLQVFYVFRHDRTKLPSLKYAHKWGRAIRKYHNHKTFNMLHPYTIKSDIPQNYPLLFGIRDPHIKNAIPYPIADRYEVRTTEAITVKHFTHIEVPLAHVVKTEKFLLEKGITLPVLPMEYGELVSSKMPLKKLLWPLMK